MAVTAAMFDQFDARMPVHEGLSEPRLSGMHTCIKIILIASNLIFVIFAIILLALGSFALGTSINQLVGSTLPVGLIFLGVIMLLLSALGGMSTIRESRVGLGVYLLVLLAIVISLFSLSIAVYVTKDSAEDYIIQGWQLSPPDVKRALEIEFECCGLTKFPQNATLDCPPADVVVIPPGQTCLPVFDDSFSSHYVAAGGAGIAFAILMGAVSMFVVVLINGITTRKRQQDLIVQHHASISNDDLSLDDGADRVLSVESDDEEDEFDDDDYDEHDSSLQGTSIREGDEHE